MRRRSPKKDRRRLRTVSDKIGCPVRERISSSLLAEMLSVLVLALEVMDRDAEMLSVLVLALEVMDREANLPSTGPRPKSTTLAIKMGQTRRSIPQFEGKRWKL